jgi:hypothetical protein
MEFLLITAPHYIQYFASCGISRLLLCSSMLRKGEWESTDVKLQFGRSMTVGCAEDVLKLKCNCSVMRRCCDFVSASVGRVGFGLHTFIWTKHQFLISGRRYSYAICIGSASSIAGLEYRLSVHLELVNFTIHPVRWRDEAGRDSMKNRLISILWIYIFV